MKVFMKAVGGMLLFAVVRFVSDYLFIWLLTPSSVLGIFGDAIGCLAAISLFMLAHPLYIETNERWIAEKNINRIVSILISIIILVADAYIIRNFIDENDFILFHAHHNVSYIYAMKTIAYIGVVSKAVLYIVCCIKRFDFSDAYTSIDYDTYSVTRELTDFDKDLIKEFQSFLKENKYHTKISFVEMSYYRLAKILLMVSVILYVFLIDYNVCSEEAFWKNAILIVCMLPVYYLLYFLFSLSALKKTNTHRIKDLILKFGNETHSFHRFDETLMICFECAGVGFPLWYKAKMLDKFLFLRDKAGVEYKGKKTYFDFDE